MFLGHDRVVYLYREKENTKKSMALLRWFTDSRLVENFIHVSSPALYDHIEFVLYFMQIIGGILMVGMDLLLEQMTEQ